MNIKKILKFVWDEFIYGGHLTSLGAISVVFTSAILLNIKITWDFLIVIYLGTYSVYLYNRYEEFKIDTSTNLQRTKHIKIYLNFIPLIIFCFILIFVGILLYFNEISSLFFGILLLLLGLLYTKFFKKFTKKIIAFKSFYISSVWSLLIIFLIIYYSFSFNLSVFLILFFIYLRIFVHTSSFDIKDIKSDRRDRLLTLPIILDQEKLFYLLEIVTIIAVMPIIFGFYFDLFSKYSLMLLFTIPYTFYYFEKLKNKKNIAYFSQLAISGEKILWPLFIVVGKAL